LEGALPALLSDTNLDGANLVSGDRPKIIPRIFRNWRQATQGDM
jgi:hypothetical protein